MLQATNRWRVMEDIGRCNLWNLGYQIAGVMAAEGSALSRLSHAPFVAIFGLSVCMSSKLTELTGYLGHFLFDKRQV